MLEPDVTITDYLLCLECVVLAWWCARRHATAHRWYVAFFISLSVASALGGTMHGFVPDGGGAVALWLGVLLSIGATAVTMWGIVVSLCLTPGAARVAMSVVAVLAVLYVWTVMGVVREFWITIVAYMPAALAMLVAYVLNRRAGGGEVLRWGIAGVALTFVAAIVQVGRVALHPHWFNHNALYHTIQAVALLAIAVAAGARLGKSDGDRHAAGQ